MSGDARADVDGDPHELVPYLLALAGVQAAADAHADRLHLVPNRHGASDCTRGCIEGRQEPIAGGVDLAPVEAGQLVADRLMVAAKEVAPRRVPELG